MEPCWRWFGPEDPTSLLRVRQAGAQGVVTALHDVPVGEPWSAAAVSERKRQIEAGGLRWSVVESLPVHGAIRLGAPGHERYVAAYKESLRALGEAGVRTVVYNFMPLLDWTRTDLSFSAADGSRALRFDTTAWAAFDVHVLERPGARAEYSEAELAAATRFFEQLDEEQRTVLTRNVVAGLPGANEAGHSLDSLRRGLESWAGVSAERLRERLLAFLQEVLPVCQSYGVCLCLHPDDPPRSLLGLPRIASSFEDYRVLFERAPQPENGMVLCLGSLGAGRSNELVPLAQSLAPRVHFTHLRSVCLEPDDSFVETGHLEGDVDIVGVVQVLLDEERRRQRAGDLHREIPFRPDHGLALDGDSGALPGYPWLGRLKALGELRGIVHAVERLTPRASS